MAPDLHRIETKLQTTPSSWPCTDTFVLNTACPGPRLLGKRQIHNRDSLEIVATTCAAGILEHRFLFSMNIRRTSNGRPRTFCGLPSSQWSRRRRKDPAGRKRPFAKCHQELPVTRGCLRRDERAASCRLKALGLSPCAARIASRGRRHGDESTTRKAPLPWIESPCPARNRHWHGDWSIPLHRRIDPMPIQPGLLILSPCIAFTTIRRRSGIDTDRCSPEW